MDFETWYNATGKSIIKDQYKILPLNELFYDLMEKAYKEGFFIGKNKGVIETRKVYQDLIPDESDFHPLYQG